MQRFYVYSFLNSATFGRGSVVKWVFVIAAITVAIFGAVNATLWMRRWITESVLGKEGKFSLHSSKSSKDKASDTTGAAAEDLKLGDGAHLSPAIV